MAAQPLRAICVLLGSGEKVQDLSRQLGDIVVNDKKDVAVTSRRIERARVDLSTGKITVFSHGSTAFISKLADIAAKTGAKSYLVKLGDASFEDTSKFAKVLSAKTEAELKTIGAQLVEELYGKNAIPVTVKALPGKDVRVYGEYSGDVTLDALKQAFSTFGPVEKVSLPNKHGVNVVFAKPEGAKAALEKKEVLCGTVAVKIFKSAPRKPKAAATARNANGTKKSGETAKVADASAGTKAYMKIENVPEGVTAKEIKELYAKFGAESADYNAQAKHCILRFSKPEGVAQVSKEKITTKNGSELIAKPYSPRGSGKKSSKANANGTNGQAAPKAKTYRVLVDNADPAKCTKEQLEATFKAFKGFVSLSQTRSDASKYTVAYDNEASVEEICKAKEITCGSAKLSVRQPEARGRKARAIIVQPPADVTVEQVKASVQALDASATVEKGAKSGDFLVDFASKEARDAALAKELKVGSHTLKFETSARATRPREPKAEFGAFFTGLTSAQATEVTDALKSVCEVAKVNSFKTGILVEVKSQKDQEKLLAASIKLKDGKTLKAEPLKRKGAN